MSSPKPIRERAIELIDYSDKVYAAIDQVSMDETRARRILRLGIQTIAHVAEASSVDNAGLAARSLLHHELTLGGIIPEDTAAWPNFTHSSRELPSPLYIPKASWNRELDDFSELYADIIRKTIDRNGDYETDASHATHLTAFALAYAGEYYPDLNPNKLAIYSLLHDAPEAYAGDTPTLGASAAVLREKDIREFAARKLIASQFGIDFPRFVEMIERYEELDDDEARYIKTADKLDPKFTYSASRGISLIRDYRYTSEQYSRLGSKQRTKLRGSYGQGYPDLLAIHCALTKYYSEQIPWQNETPA